MSDDLPSEDLADLYDNAPCGYISLTPDQRIVRLNGTLASWLDRDGASLVGKSVHEILSFGGRIAFETHLAPLLRLQGHVYEIALDLVCGDGGRLEVIANAAERRGPDGGHLFTRLTVFRATDRRKFERSLVEARIKAEEATRAEHAALELRDQFIAVLGHDLRNPIAAVRSGVSMLRRREGLDERGLLIVSEMDASLERANRLIGDILDFARGKLGNGMEIEIRPDSPVRSTLAQVLSEMRSIFPERKFDFVDRVDLPVSSDPHRLAQLASNLLGNAAVHGDPELPITLEAATSEETFTLSVSNGGRPLSEDVRDHLFEPFFRESAHRSRNGLGLGLFIVRQIAQAHDGDIAVSSDDTETRFTLTIPRCRDVPETSD